MKPEEVLEQMRKLMDALKCIKKEDPCIDYTVSLSQLKGAKEWLERKIHGGNYEN